MECVRKRRRPNFTPEYPVKIEIDDFANVIVTDDVKENLADYYPGTVTELPSFECELCKKKFRRKPLLKRHLHSLHPFNFPSRNVAEGNVLSSLLFECHDCGKKYARRDYLLLHVRSKHLTKPTIYECSPCGLVWTTKESLRRHSLLNHSKGEINVEQKNSRTIELRCTLCGETFNQRIKILRHYEQSHHIAIETENLRFTTEKEFFRWKTNVEKTKTCNFRRRSRHKNKEYTHTLFACHRSGSYESKAHVRRCLKSSKKVNGFCPSEMKLRTRKEGCDVVFVKTHVGHSIDSKEELAHITCLKRRDRQRIVRRINSRIPLSRAADDDESAGEEDLYISEVHVSNDDVPDGITTDHSRYPSRVACALHVDDFIVLNSLSILYFKNAGTIDPSRPDWKKEDTALVFMSPRQEEMLKKFGHDVIALDSVVKSPGFILQTLLVIDEHQMSYPVAFALSNRNGALLVDVLLHRVRDEVGLLRPSILMTDVESTCYGSWVEIMGEPQTRVYSPWHIWEAWNARLTDIADADKRARVKKQLLGAAVEPDELKFEDQMNDFLYDDDAELAAFRSHFRHHYLANIDCWAYCYQIVAGSKTKVCVSSFKTYARCRLGTAAAAKCLSSGLQTIERQLARADVGRKRAEVAEKLEEKLKALRQRHDLLEVNVGADLSAYVHQTAAHEWSVSSVADQADGVIEVNVVTRLMAGKCNRCPLVCDRCDVCLHQFQCTCDDACLKLNMCVHVHLLGMYMRLRDDPLEDGASPRCET